MKPKKRLQAPTQKKSKQDQNTPEQKGDIPAPKVITEPSQEGKQDIPASRMTFSGGSRGTFQKNSSENTSSQDNGAPVTIKPKVNNTSSIKAPLKNFGKKSETKKNDGKKSEKSPLKERKLKGRHTAKRSLANIPTKGDKIINIETIEPADDIVTRKSENNFIKLEELKENDPELTPNSNLELDSDEASKGYNTAQNQPNTRIEIINKKQKKAKDTIGNKLKKVFGMKKPSQQKEAKSLACSFVGSNTKPKIKTKVNQTLVDYNGTKSVKKVKQKNTQSFLTRPQSTLKQPKTSPKKNRGHAKVSDLMDSDDDSSCNYATANPVRSSFDLQLTNPKQAKNKLRQPQTSRLKARGNLSTYQGFDEDMSSSGVPKLNQSVYKKSAQKLIQPKNKMSFIGGLKKPS